MTKRILGCLLSLCLLLGGCKQATPTETEMDAEGILRTMLAAAPEQGGSYYQFDTLSDTLTYFEMYYGIPAEDISEAAVIMLKSASAFELAVIRLADHADPEQSALRCRQHLLSRQGDFTGYAPDQAELAANGLVLSKGQWLALAITEDTQAVLAAFESCFSPSDTLTMTTPEPTPGISEGRIPYTDPEIDDMTLYDTSAILAAWEGGDTSSLSKKDAAILAAAEKVLTTCITDGMTDYEKELALYAWVATNLDYDWNHQDPALEMDPDSGNPYGGLINHTAICLGFATTFQLLMDMAGIECITVVGAAFSSREDHAWNMVRLDGEWYCVDATWDMGSPPEYFGYFNVTSEIMYHTDHQWDYASVPEATATDGGKP